MASITIPSAAKSPFLLSAPIIVLLLLIAPASTASTASPASYGNVLSSGNALEAGGLLVNGKYNFTMQHDCNLVLYDGEDAIWSSRTHGKDTKCSLVLQKNGELFVKGGSGKTVWRSKKEGKYGHYALVLQPNGDVVVYGTPVWSTGAYVAQV